MFKLLAIIINLCYNRIMTQEELQQKIKDAPNIWMKRKYLVELQEMKKKCKCSGGATCGYCYPNIIGSSGASGKDKPVSLLRGTSKMIIRKGKPVIK